jgi:hypothetical protein
MLSNNQVSKERRILLVDDEPDIYLTFKEGIGRDAQGKYDDVEYNQYCKLNKDMFLQKPICLEDLTSKINLVLSN